MGQKRITDQRTYGQFVLNVMRAMVQVITEICSLQSKKYFLNSSSPTKFFKNFYLLLALNMANLMQLSLS